MKFLGIEKVPLMGNQQWRAPEMFFPPEPYLASSVFVDYIGSYKKLPYGLHVPTQDSPYFTSPDKLSSLDLSLLARHSISIASRALKKAPKDRKNLRAKLRKMRNESKESFFRSRRVFDRNQVSNWPTFLFSMSKDNLHLIFDRVAEEARLRPTPYEGRL